MKPGRLFWLWRSVWLFCLCMTGAAAAEGLRVDTMREVPQSLTGVLGVLEDHSLKLMLADVQNSQIAQRFKVDRSAPEAFNFGFGSSAYWLRLQLRNDSDQPVERMLEIGNPRFESVQFYEPSADGGYRVWITGCNLPFNSRPYPNKGFVFPLTVPAHSSALYYLRIEAIYIGFPAKLWTPSAFYAHQRTEYWAQAWYFGMVAAMVLFNLLIYLALRDVMYLRYISFTVTSALAMAAQHGLAKEFLWPNALLLSDSLISIANALSLVALVSLMRHMLQTSKVVAQLDRLLGFLVGLLLLFSLGFVFWLEQLAKPGAMLFLMTMLATLGASLICAWRRARSAYFFVAAFAILMTGASLSILRTLGLIPVNVVTTNGFQVGSALEMLLLAFALADRLHSLIRETARAQQQALEAQQLLLENLQSSEQVLAQRVEQRTAALLKSNTALSQTHAELDLACQAAEVLRHQAEHEERQTVQTLNELHAAQDQLIQAEKMAGLGQLVASVATDLAAPIDCIEACGTNIAGALNVTLVNVATLFRVLDADHMARFLRLVEHANAPGRIRNKAQVRGAIRRVAQQLEQLGLPDARATAGALVQLNGQTIVDDCLPLLRHAEATLILTVAQNLRSVTANTDRIDGAVNRVSKIIGALKSFSHFNPGGKPIRVDLREGMETVLTIYLNLIKENCTLVRQYQDIAPIDCWPDELNQVWIHLIHNALQAMSGHGTLTVAIHREADEAVVSISDSGCGIAEHLHEKIFEPFFTTGAAGAGSGLGLDVVRRIVRRHRGRITFSSALGVGTTFSVFLPYDMDASH
jgi:C4-dicarboxylate-specific signal transduction histidine kinase